MTLLLPALLAFAISADGDAQPRADTEPAGWLSTPQARGWAVLELGSALSMPRGRGAALPRSPRERPTPATIAATVPIEPATSPQDRELRPVSAATAGHPAAVSLLVGGDLAVAMRALIATDLAYLPELLLDDRGSFVIRGSGSINGDRASIELAICDVERPATGRIVRRHDGPAAELATAVHGFVDDAVEALTGRRSAFASRLVFARRSGPGRKSVWLMDADGGNLRMVSAADGLAILPTFGDGDVWYTVLSRTGSYITRLAAEGRPIVGGPGTHAGAAVCGGRLLFSAARDGNTDIYSVALDGSDERRLTTHRGIDVSPACGPDGRVAFVSDRSGQPQIWVMSADGAGQRWLVRRPYAAQTPNWCDGLLAFTAVGGGAPTRVVVADLERGTTTRVSPAGVNEHPSFSPDCRMLAWASPQGIVVARVDGRLRRLIAAGRAESVRWER